jgi:hypothetical protein
MTAQPEPAAPDPQEEPLTSDELIEHLITTLRGSQRWASVLDYVQAKTLTEITGTASVEDIRLAASHAHRAGSPAVASRLDKLADLLGGTGSQPECIHCNPRTGQCSNCLRSVEQCRCGRAIDGGTGSHG